MSHRGWLKKKSGGVLGTYQRRFLVLDNSTLSYFKTETSPSPQGVIALATSRLDPTSSKLKFAVVTPGRTYDFTTATEEDRAEWVAKLGPAIAAAADTPGAASAHAAADAVFASIDVNSDGTITDDELLVACLERGVAEEEVSRATCH